ncbi:unnamed protein product (macronuclear) [Paramecium tetraurelia]|uniref:VHS domain-containing protein n=1 Tax=Paramecium tetraurelia TaxID=5888 RepID=A0BH86_PARTE|nr:uncharacterized protein GSPATT00028938001 [Paramecium tetraurelia]CAK57903.1 unnamed protein product [Paramecium tetraurelia]|eukprot:XP_001425301.1 hypothetical protein (macronuclear) [Paramecium tetraurelia strain d4-2]
MEDLKKQYSKINKELREQIIHQILDEKKSIADVILSYLTQVAQQHNILMSTCKSIINTYMREGRVGKKESRVRKLKKIIRIYDIVLNPIQPQMSTYLYSQKTENCIEKSIKSQKEDNEQKEIQENQNNDNFMMLSLWCEQIKNQFAPYGQPNYIFQPFTQTYQK